MKNCPEMCCLSKKEWVALLTTDLHTSEEEIIRLYGLRWDIEVFFRTIKQHLGFNRGVQVRDFDSIIGNTTIVAARYIFLSIEQRKRKDIRTLGTLFREYCQELKNVTLVTSLQRILELSLESVAQNNHNIKLIEAIFTEISAILIFTT